MSGLKLKSAAGGSVTTNRTQVYVSGVYQNKSRYTVSGHTLTFTEAPPLNAIIEVNAL